jgi:hypothetical protein
MNNHSRAYKPPFSKFEQKLRSLVDVLFGICCGAFIFPFLCWGALPSKLAIEWNSLGKPIEWISKGDAFLNTLPVLAFLGLIHWGCRMQAANPALIRYGGTPSPKYLERTYRFGRIGVLGFAGEAYIGFTYNALCRLNAYLFGFDTPFRSSMPVIFGAIGLVSLLVWVISIADPIK